MAQFPHLKFVQKITGKPRLFGGGSDPLQTLDNKRNRQGHGSSLLQQTDNIKNEWAASLVRRAGEGLAALDADTIPVFLKINPAFTDLWDFSLEKLGIEIISEEEGGFIIGASIDGLHSLREKIEGFIISRYGTTISISNLWLIVEGDRRDWKPQLILSEDLFAKWNMIQDEEFYQLEVSIAFDKPLGPEPDPNLKGGERRLEKYLTEVIERDEKLMGRETHFANFINQYGQITSALVNYEDSFSCEVRIHGKGLKDFVFNYPFVFEVKEKEQLYAVEGNEENLKEGDLVILPPQGNAPEVAIIDSGIMENHRFISAAINPAKSKSYVDGDPSTADYVSGGGHGTKVAGAVLFPNGILNVKSPYQLPCAIRNLRVLDHESMLSTKYPAALMKDVVDENKDVKIFNLSISSRAPHPAKHMSTWAAYIDSIIHSNNLLFVISSGNIMMADIRGYISGGEQYPLYLSRPYCRIANPGQSSFSLTVGSLNHAGYEDEDWTSLGDEENISAFSRIGPGIWGGIKPDVVEHGGGLVISKNGRGLIKESVHTSPELIRSTLGGGAGVGKDSVGTSFATPKVTFIAAELLKLYPNENLNLIRALIVQGARLPGPYFQHPTLLSLQQFGYGLPKIERVTDNTQHRITFYDTGSLAAEEGNVYALKIPRELRSAGDDFDILIEITMAYTAKVRRTRQKTKSYLSTWLDWSTSKLDESFDDFKKFTLKEINSEVNEYDKEVRGQMEGFQWMLSERKNWGQVHDMHRNNSTVQKDWTIIKSNQLPEEISFVVRAHKGWDKDREKVPYAWTISIEVLGTNIPIYESIRIANEVEIEAEFEI